jgi:transcriptional regulator with XRE-family HTH domain
MSYAVLARRSGVSMPTVVRILNATTANPGLGYVKAIAAALGMGVSLEPKITARELLARQARQRARQLVGIVQATSGLEAQAVDDEAVREMTHQTVHELLAGSPRRLWGE